MNQPEAAGREGDTARLYAAQSAGSGQTAESGRLFSGPADLAGHVGAHGPLPGHDGPAILDAVDRSGLTGRGGAAFPTGRKMRAVVDATARVRRSARQQGAVVVANGCEGEPASAKDRTLLTRAPHLVLDGIAAAARAIGANRAHLCLHEDEHALIQVVQLALKERRSAGIDAVDVQIAALPHRYVASEETSLIQFLDGGPAMPRFTPPRPFERGVAGRPTLVDNVETLAHVGLIARHGPAWFRASGMANAPGTALVTVGGAVTHPGVYEISLGITGAELLELAGGAAEPLQAVLTGGYFGAWLPESRFLATRIAPKDLAAAGAAMGAGIFVALPRTSCALAETARVARYMAEQSAGQCGPCINGLPALAGALEALARRGDTRAPDYINSLAPYVAGRGACHHPDGTTRLIASALSVFAADVRTHLGRGPCAGTRRPSILPLPALAAEAHR
ncbi:MAG TPA: NADH-ubiquinone oxidoreductase-F iron-sulfur binding region domain-containing protein [Actinocrinis sp.]|uniref:NADH-ubiquinone oxidoreductase-F iron-sulfur binding region domain-containing protein n=1 Tax=Actinocrinis sp. TaxID=1920516 RepID=UPI002DDCEA61|nr:NADH-ubiquinone oxidoreductase-F iron-sulfur binding region domain-containing protein [Actinocrinis sp.]HEV3172552.1 NADH-ubiquinone oxidoreductase-F iron-sulfur binding region domain-containing protein [Actinocrinis sp.]